MQSKEWREKIMKKNEQRPREMQHTSKKNDLHVMRVPKGETRKRSRKITLRNNGSHAHIHIRILGPITHRIIIADNSTKKVC